MAEEHCRTVEVKGICEQTSQDTLENYFSLAKRGGKISHIQYDRLEGRACITFEEPEGAQKALQSTPHRIDNVELNVNIKLAVNVESNKLYVEGFRKETSSDSLKYYVESISGQDVTDVILGPRCNAIVTVDGVLDFDRIHQLSQTKQLDGNILTIRRVPVPRTILVSDLPPSATRDALLYKFESPRSGGGEIENVRVNLQERTALVKFKDPTVLRNVLSRKQTLDGTQLMVRPYHVLIGGMVEKQPKTGHDHVVREPTVATGQLPYPSTTPGSNEPAVVRGPYPSTTPGSNEPAVVRGPYPSTTPGRNEPAVVRNPYPSATPRSNEPAVVRGQPPRYAPTKHHVEIDRDLFAYLMKNHPQNLKMALKDMQPTVDEGNDSIMIAVETNDAENDLKAFLQEYKCKVVEFDPALIDNGLDKKIDGVQQIFESSGTAVSFKSRCSEGFVKIIGRALNQHNMAVEEVKKCVNEAKEKRDKETMQCEELIELSPEILKLVQSSEKYRTSQTAWTKQGVDARVVTASGISVKGSQHQVDMVKSEIVRLVAIFGHRDLNRESSSFLLGSPVATSYVKELLRENKLEIEFSTSDSKKIILHGLNQASVDEAYQYIESTVGEITFPLSETSINARRQELHDDFVNTVESCEPISLHVENDELRIVCFQKDLSEVRRKAVAFFEGKKHKEVDVPLEKAVARYLRLHGEEVLKGLRFSSPGLEIEWRSDTTIVVSGPQPLATSCVTSIKSMVHGLSTETMEFGTPETCASITSETAKKSILGIEQARKCAIVVNEREVREEQRRPRPRSTTAAGETKELMRKTRQCTYTYPNGKIVEVYQGDILDHPVDFLVNAANAKLKHKGGVAKAIVDKGGRKIQEDCSNYLKESGKPKLMPCDVVMTDGGALLCRKILHVVVPKWTSDGSSEATEGTKEGRMLRHACLGVLNNAKEGKTVAMPALGTGVYNVPHCISARSLVTAVDEFVKENTQCGLKEIHFVDNEPKAVEAFMKEMIDRYGSDSNFHIDETVRHRWAAAPKTDVPVHDVVPDSDDGKEFTTKEGMKIELTIGNIATCKADVIVNTANNEMMLTRNPCSKAILEVAGDELTRYCEQWKVKAKGPLKQGSFAVTDGAKLKCKKVFHANCLQWKADNGEKNLGELIQSMFAEAVRLKFTSIALPALGTGSLKYPEESVAKVLFEEAIKFSAANQGAAATARLKHVNVVVYGGNATAVMKFKEKFKFYSTKRKPTPTVRRTVRPPPRNWTTEQPPSFAPPRRTRDESDGRETRVSESAGENDLKIEIVQGDMTEESTDAIGLLVDNIITRSGQLGQALKAAAGMGLLREYNGIAKVDSGTIVVTSAGDLKVKCLLHMVTTKTGFLTERISSKSIIESVVKCLNETELFGLESISLPAVGTGALKKDSEGSVEILYAGIREYAAGPSRSLKLIRIVILQPKVFDVFRNGFMEKQRENPLPRSSVSVVSGAAAPAAEPNERSVPREPSRVRRCVSLDVVGDRSCSMAEIKADLSQIEKERRMYKEIQNETIAELPQKYLDEIMELESRFCVVIDSRWEIGCLGLTGLSENVAHAAAKIYEKIYTYEHDKHSAAIRGQAVQWLFYDGRDGSEDIVIPEKYPTDVSGQIEKAYQDKTPKVSVDDAKYVIDFGTMVETNLATHEVMKVFRSSCEGFPLPKHWDCQPITRATGQEEEVHLAHVDPHDQPKEFDAIYERFKKTMPDATVESIQRVQNPRLYQIYKSQQEKMNERGGCNEQKLFHGTSKATMISINSTGFNRSYCGKNAVKFGNGVYFARDASYSARKIYAMPDDKGVQYMYVAQILVGRYTMGKEGILVPPPNYDSVVNNASNPEIFVVFYDYQSYPEYLISFKAAKK